LLGRAFLLDFVKNVFLLVCQLSGLAAQLAQVISKLARVLLANLVPELLEL